MSSCYYYLQIRPISILPLSLTPPFLHVSELYIDSGNICSINSLNPAISTDGLPSNATLHIFNEGIIHGRGGDGSCATHGMVVMAVMP